MKDKESKKNITNMTFITPAKFGTETHLRMAFFAAAFKLNGVKVKFIKSKTYGLFKNPLNSFKKIFTTIFSKGILYVFNPDKSLKFYIRIRKLLKKKFIIDIWKVGKEFLKKNPVANFFLNNASLITYSNKNVAILLAKVFGVNENDMYQLKTGGNGLELITKKQNIKSMGKNYGLPEFDIKDSFKKVLLYTGDFSNKTSLDEILISFSIIADRADDVIFVIAGAGSNGDLSYLKNVLKNLDLEKRAIFMRNLFPADMKLWIEKATMLIEYFGEEREEFFRESIYLREALNLEKPVVCSKGGELVLFAPYVYQVECDNVELVSEIVRVVVEGTDGREKQGGEFVNENLDYEIITDTFLKEVEI